MEVFVGAKCVDMKQWREEKMREYDVFSGHWSR